MASRKELAQRRERLTFELQKLARKGGQIPASKLKELTGVPASTLRTLLVAINEGRPPNERIRLIKNNTVVRVPGRIIVEPVIPRRSLSFRDIRHVGGLGAAMIRSKNVIK